MNLESFEKKLIIPRDIEGNINERELRAIDQIAEELKNEKSIVGIMPFGSSILGYKKPDSDLDIEVLYDTYLVPEENSGNDDLSKERLEKVCEGIKAEILKNKGLEVNFSFIDLRFNRMIEDIKGGYWKDHSLSIAWLCRFGRGPKIEEYRKQLSGYFEKLAEDRKVDVAHFVAVTIMACEEPSLLHLCERVPEYASKEKELAEERTKMWEERVKKLFNNRV